MKNKFFHISFLLLFMSCTENKTNEQNKIFHNDVESSMNLTSDNEPKIVFFDTEKIILSKLFDGKYDTTDHKIVWKAGLNKKMPLSDDGHCHTNIDDILYFENYEKKYALVVLKTIEYTKNIPNDCAGCAPVVGIALFQQINSEWKLIKSKPNVCKLGQGGYVPDKKIVQIGKNDYVLSLAGKELAGGGYIGTEYEYFYFLDDKKFGELMFNYNKAEVVGEINQEISLIQESDIEFIKSDKKRYFDIKISSAQYDYSIEPKKLIKLLPEKILKIN